MLVLALDTTTRQGSIALTRDGALVGDLCGRCRDRRMASDCREICCGCSARTRCASPMSMCLPSRLGQDRSQDFASASPQCRALRSPIRKPLVGISALDAINDAVPRPRLSLALRAKSLSGWMRSAGRCFRPSTTTALRRKAPSWSSPRRFFRAGNSMGCARTCLPAMAPSRIVT